MELENSFRSASQENEDAVPKAKQPKQISLISSKRTQQINIFLKSSRMTNEQIIQVSKEPVQKCARDQFIFFRFR